MIGHYVDTLSAAAEDRVLTTKLGYAPHWQNQDCRCLVGAACNLTFGGNTPEGKEFSRGEFYTWSKFWSVAQRYDELMLRFGERLNIAIRNRILANRARRALANVQPVTEEISV